MRMCSVTPASGGKPVVFSKVYYARLQWRCWLYKRVGFEQALTAAACVLVVCLVQQQGCRAAAGLQGCGAAGCCRRFNAVSVSLQGFLAGARHACCTQVTGHAGTQPALSPRSFASCRSQVAPAGCCCASAPCTFRHMQGFLPCRCVLAGAVRAQGCSTNHLAELPGRFAAAGLSQGFLQGALLLSVTACSKPAKQIC